jgi:hypothetical protein
MENIPDSVVKLLNLQLNECIEKRKKIDYNLKYKEVIDKAMTIIQNTNDNLEKVYETFSNT